MNAKSLAFLTAGAVLGAGLLVTTALLPISWEFVGPKLDVVGHMAGVCFTALALALVFRRRQEPFWSCIRRLVLACLASIAFWLSIEGIQYFIPHHSPQWDDAMSDFWGLYVGVFVVFIVEVSLLRRSERAAAGTVL